MDEQIKVPDCPKCGRHLDVLLFMGVEPDGLVCTACKLWFDDDLNPIATVL